MAKRKVFTDYDEQDAMQVTLRPDVGRLYFSDNGEPVPDDKIIGYEVINGSGDVLSDVVSLEDAKEFITDTLCEQCSFFIRPLPKSDLASEKDYVEEDI